MGEVVDLKRDEETGRFVPGNVPPLRHSERSPEEQAAAVAIGEVVGTPVAAEVTGIPRRTIRRWSAEEEVLPDGSRSVPKENRALAREVLAEKFEELLYKYVEHLHDEQVIKTSSARDAATVIGILADKSLKLRGEDKPSPLDQPLTLGDYMLSLAAQAAAAKQNG